MALRWFWSWCRRLVQLVSHLLAGSIYWIYLQAQCLPVWYQCRSVQISAYLSIYCKQSVCLFGISADLCNFGEMWLCHSRQISLEFISLEIVKTISKRAIPEWPLKMAPQWRRILEKVKVADCFTFLLFQPLFVSSHGGEVGASLPAGFFISSEIPVMPVFSSMSCGLSSTSLSKASLLVANAQRGQQGRRQKPSERWFSSNDNFRLKQESNRI